MADDIGGRARLRSDMMSDDDGEEEEVEEDDRPACFGELEFLGLSPVRKTAVKALTPCVCRILNREMVLHVARDTDMEVYSSMLLQMFQKTVHKTSAEQASVLMDFISAGCSDEFLQQPGVHTLLVSPLIWELNKKYCSRSLQMVMSSVRVIGVGKKDLPRLGKGDVFGRMSALSLRPRPSGASALYAAEHCCVEVLHQDVVVRALEIYHDQRGKVLTLDREAKAAAGAKAMDFVEIVASSRIFSDMSHAFVQELAASAIDRIFMPGDVVMHQGAVEFSMFILVTGTADVFVSDVSKSDDPYTGAKERSPVRH
ncbi:Hcn1, partial [Symbiodinium necroappetens]